MSPEAVPPGPVENQRPTPQISPPIPEPPPTPSTDSAEPPTELTNDIRKRLAEVPQEALARADRALMHEPIQEAAGILWRAGVCLSSGELYEYRKTLFPPNAIVDPYTQGPPVLRDASDAPPATADAGSSINAQPSGIQEQATLTPGNLSAQEATHSKIHPSLASAGASLLNDLHAVMNRYVVLPEMAAEALALWVVHTYAFHLRQVTTYIGVVSPEKRCGKTTLLELLGSLANRSLTASNISPSALFRVIEETQPTLLIDEADTFLQGRDELAGILNAGYRKGNSYVVRIAANKNTERAARRHDDHSREPEFAQWSNERVDGSPCATEFAKYSCWCPKVMAAIGRLPDTLADRCVVITMQRKMPGEKCERIRQLNASDFRKRCAQLVRENSEKIAKARPEIPSNLNDRAADIWEPLFAIADLAGGEWPELARQAAQKLSASDDDLTLIGYFLKDLRNLMIIRNVDRMLSRDVVSKLNPMHDRPWEDLRRGREINEWWLGWQLRQLGIRTKTMRAGEAMGKGYTLADIEAAFRRYVPNAELHMAPPGLTEQLAGSIAPGKGAEVQIEAQFERLMKQLLTGLPKND